MAYLAFQDLGGPMAERARAAAPVGVVPDLEQLTALEWSVVALARNDSRASLRSPNRLSAAFRMLFRQRNPKLADGRLEALRRMAVLTWQDGYRTPSREVRAFMAAGFTAGQYETLADSIGVAKSRRPRR